MGVADIGYLWYIINVLRMEYCVLSLTHHASRTTMDDNYYGSSRNKNGDNGTVGPGGKHPGLALT